MVVFRTVCLSRVRHDIVAVGPRKGTRGVMVLEFVDNNVGVLDIAAGHMTGSEGLLEGASRMSRQTSRRFLENLRRKLDSVK